MDVRLFEALQRMPVRHRSVSALALVRALTMASDVRCLGEGLRFVLVVSTRLAMSGHVKILLCNVHCTDKQAALCLDKVGVSQFLLSP